jgi:hypothetical protein
MGYRIEDGGKSDSILRKTIEIELCPDINIYIYIYLFISCSWVSALWQ